MYAKDIVRFSNDVDKDMSSCPKRVIQIDNHHTECWAVFETDALWAGMRGNLYPSPSDLSNKGYELRWWTVESTGYILRQRFHCYYHMIISIFMYCALCLRHICYFQFWKTVIHPLSRLKTLILFKVKNSVLVPEMIVA